MNTKRALTGVGLATLLLLTSGCGKAAEKASEKATEKAIESQGGGKVDIDGDKIKVDDGSGGSCTYTDDKMDCTGKAGDTEYSSGGNAKLPAGWPDELKPPKGTELVSAGKTTAGGKQVLTANGIVDASEKDVYEALKEQLTDAGYEITGDGNTVTVGVTGNTAGEGSVVTMGIAEN
jgi:hypothetical protein